MSSAIEQKGLTSQQAKDLTEKYGLNILPEGKVPTLFIIFLQQFLNPFIYILLAAAIVSLFLKEMSNAIFIFAVLLINAAIGSFQEYSASKAALALKQIVPKFSTVIRDGKIIKISSQNVVIGDVMLLESGDKVAADIKLISSHNLTIDESILTGESLEVIKDSKVRTGDDTPLGECYNMAFAGTIITRGRGSGIVTATASNTQIGKIAKTITAKKQTKPPLLLRIEDFTLKITYFTLISIALLMWVFLARGQSFIEIIFISVALAIAAIPEGLPAAMTVALAIGMRRMAAKNVIIRKLIAAEALGSCTFIASDKTGTLTINELTANKIALPGNDIIEIEGQGLQIEENQPAKIHKSQIARLCRAGVLANEAQLEIKNNKVVKARGDMVDVAFLILGEKYQIKQSNITTLYPQIDEIPYESENGYCASICSCDDMKYIFTKGSTEKIINMCSKMSGDDADIMIDKQVIIRQEQELARQGYRVLAVAEGSTKNNVNKDKLFNLTFLGLVAMIDPVRKEVKPAMQYCRSANIEVAMITGDHPDTALAIAHQCGLVDSNDDRVITGKQIDEALKKGKEYLNKFIAKTHIFARIAPMQKREIVSSLIANNHFVAVTGDGVNDAPALKQAHIGIAMGKSGSDITKEAADIILADDNFASIIEGIKQGRIIYNNIRKVIFLLITTGFAEIVLFLLSIGNVQYPVSKSKFRLNLISAYLQKIYPIVQLSSSNLELA
ncbi:MAG: calcium-translocating P-type ATPase [Rickettsiales bacterium]|jgi:calcium-translocating P-type ATPase